MNTINPISKDQAIFAHLENIPDSIIDAVNKLLIKHVEPNGVTIIYVNDILDIVCSDDPDSGKPTRNEVYDNRWLDIEPLYRELGWKVSFEETDAGTGFFSFS